MDGMDWIGIALFGLLYLIVVLSFITLWLI